MDLLDTWEDLTEIGNHLVNFPVELKYGKMILYSIVLKCLNPILIITSALSVNESSTLI
jgi:ATP-dependent RNA helicase YTHDC2